MELFKKKETIIENVFTREVDGAKAWILSWNAYSAQYEGRPDLTDIKKAAKVFLSEKDAFDYKNMLIKASELLQCDNLAFNFEIEEQI